MVCNFRNETHNFFSVDISTTAADTGVYFPVVWGVSMFAEFPGCLTNMAAGCIPV